MTRHRLTRLRKIRLSYNYKSSWLSIFTLEIAEESQDFDFECDAATRILLGGEVVKDKRGGEGFGTRVRGKMSNARGQRGEVPSCNYDYPLVFAEFQCVGHMCVTVSKPLDCLRFGIATSIAPPDNRWRKSLPFTAIAPYDCKVTSDCAPLLDAFREACIGASVYQNRAILCSCGTDFQGAQDARFPCDPKSPANGDFSAMKMDNIESHCGIPCDTQVCGEKLLANVSRCPSTVSRTVSRWTCANFQKIILVSPTVKEKKHILSEYRLSTVSFDCFQVRFGLVGSTVWIGSEHGFAILLDDRASDSHTQNSTRTAP